jgi:hypothetical protein
MPNWCSNGLTLTHSDPAMIDRVIKGKDGLLQEFIPCPQALIATVSGYVGDEQAALEARQAANREQYGYPTWYEHNIAEWGTKWDFSADSIKRMDANTVQMSFESAWAPPLNAYEKLMALGFEVEATYYEPGMAFCGRWKNGEDDYYEYGGMTADEIEATLPKELDEEYGISQAVSEWEQEQEEENMDIDLDGGVSATNE